MFIDIMIIYLISTFLICGIPFGLVIGKIFGHIDIRRQGSGNIGATNVGRILGKKYAILTFVLDGLKSFLPVLIAKKIFYFDFATCTMFFAVAGHIYSVWLKGKGGKGISTLMLSLLALDYRLFLIMALSWLLFFKITKISAVAALTSVTLVTAFSYFLVNRFCFYTFLLIFLMIIYAHKDNIKRLINKKELNFHK